MKLFSPSRRPSGFIEPLEARVAPAIINIGFPTNGGTAPNTDTSYDLTKDHDARPPGFNSLLFTPTFVIDPGTGVSSPAGDKISQAVDDPGVSGTYYLQLTKGDVVQVYNTVGSTYTGNDLISVKSGTVIAYFTDINHDNHYEEGELTGLSLSANASVQINGRVYGDVMTNLAADGSIHTSDPIGPKQGIKSLVVGGGSIFGNVLSGGNISTLHVAQGVDNVLAGTAANGAHYDFFQIPDTANPGQILKRFTVDATEPAGQVGASISNVSVGFVGRSITTIGDNGPVTSLVPGVIQAGDGGAGAKGGSLTNISVQNDDQVFSLQAGAGGAAGGSGKGGAGGGISKVIVSGVANSTPDPLLPNPHANELITIHAGNGGAGSQSGAGGAGGSLNSIFVGYDSATTASFSISADDVLLQGGDGGAGKTGGAGGSITLAKVRVVTPLFDGHEITIQGGHGGATTSASGGASGKGGSLTNLDVRNQVDTTGAVITLQAGDAGDGGVAAKGGAGGSVSSVSALGFNIDVYGGAGANGKSGGAGGSVTGVNVLQGLGVDILNQNAIFDGGIGGAGAAGNGGNGGAVSKIDVPFADYANFEVNEGLHGNGGASTGGKGGNGGAVNNISVTDVDHHPGDVVLSLAGVAAIRAGDGGNGSKGGGTGGSLNVVAVSSEGLSVTAKAGSGGNATLSGRGGAGGALTKVNFTLADNFLLTNQIGVSVSGELLSGIGGAGLGTGAGGAGGNLSSVDVDAAGDAAVIAGSGGAGQVAGEGLKGSAPGKGGSVVASGVFAESGAGMIRAGDAGSTGVGAAAGGTIIGGSTTNSLVGLRALTDLTIMAGNGFGGGAGGSIMNVTYGVSSGNGTGAGSDVVGATTPVGDIKIQAGNGSVGTRAGAGGSITHLSGSVSSGDSKTTSITAGKGDANEKVSSAGGSVADVTISGGGAPHGLFTIAAGDAGVSTGAKVGAKGGSVNQVQVIGLDLIDDPVNGPVLKPMDQQTDFQSIAAGNGTNAVNGKGGAGGSITEIHVQNHDIGLRTGAVFGYNSAGGLFAGVGGTGKTDPTGKSNGVNGGVSQVNADAIASIVAGRTSSPQMAQSVDHILLNKNNLITQKTFVAPGSYTLTFGANTTLPLPAGATNVQVQNALNGLQSILDAGGVTVSYGQLPGTYIVLFTATGAQAAVSGTETVNATSSELIAGSLATVPVIETTPGGQVLPQTIVQPGQFSLVPVESIHGTTFLTATTVVAGDADTGVNAIESINISDIVSSPTARFNLSFGGNTTANLLGSSTAVQIASALNALPSISGTGGVGGVGGVTVTAGTVPGVFNITFGTPQDVATITGTKLQREIQTLNVSSLSSLPGATYTITFNGSTTKTALHATDTALAVQTALNQVATIALAGGVTVTNVINPAGVAIPGDYNITFQTIGEQTLFKVVAITKQAQTLDLSPIQGDGNGANVTFSVSPSPGVTQTTNPVAIDASAAAIQTELNKLPAVTAAGGVTVVPTSAHTFTIIYGNTGAEPTIVPTENVQEVQTVNVSTVDHVATGGFTLTFNGKTTNRLPANATAADVATALNGLSSVIATGPGGANGAVTVTPAGADQFEITFNTVGQRTLITAAGSIAEQQQVEVYAPVNVDPGQPGAQPAPFTLTYGNATTPTLSGGASAQAVSDALNALKPISDLGGVTVTAQNSVYTVTFKTPGIAPGTLVTGTETENLIVNTTIPGTSSTSTQELIAPGATGALNPAAFAVANLVGSIYDINSRDANVFHYLHNGVISTGNFQLGDTPIDGIVMAKNLDQSTINFTPEAKFTAAGFFDNDNIF